MRRPAAAVILIIFLFITGLACTGPSEEGTKAYNRGDYDSAYRLVKPLAEQEADIVLGMSLRYYESCR